MACELSARIVPGDAKCLQYRQAVSQSCRTCQPYQEFVPAMQLPDSAKKNLFTGDPTKIGRRLGTCVSPAVELAVKYFDSINSQLDAGGSWITICNLIKQATGAVFDRKTLQRYFTAETVRRGMPVRELLQGSPRSRKNRLVAR